VTAVLALVAAGLYAVGTYLLLQRRLTRIIIGLVFMGHGANLLLLMAGGPPGDAPFIGSIEDAPADPLPQALALTAIVITFGITAFLLALAYRSWILTADDEVEDDLEDRRIARLRRAEGRELADEDAARQALADDRAAAVALGARDHDRTIADQGPEGTPGAPLLDLGPGEDPGAGDAVDGDGDGDDGAGGDDGRPR
jgi:multicomponent Na+:H+ antiporter subunit C